MRRKISLRVQQQKNPDTVVEKVETVEEKKDETVLEVKE